MTRAGHSLAELMAAVAVLGVGLAAAGSMALMGGRRTADALARQEGTALAERYLDSLLAYGTSGPPTVGVAVRGPWAVRWTVGTPDSADVRWVDVAVTWPGADRAVRLQGATAPTPPPFPAPGRAP